MHIVEKLKFAVGVVSLLIGLVMLWRARGTRGFNQARQMGALLLAAGIIFVAIGFGLDIKSLFR
jgi:uncharacterized membrane protein